MLRGKKIKWIILAILIALILIFVFSKTPWFMELKIRTNRNRLEASFNRESALYTAVAHEFLSGEERPYFSLGGTSQLLTEALQDKIRLLQKDCPVDIDTIYSTDERYLEYPTNACVFSTTVEWGDDVYAWVELVYSTDTVEQLFADYQEALEEGVVTELSDNWYIMVHYGY